MTIISLLLFSESSIQSRSATTGKYTGLCWCTPLSKFTIWQTWSSTRPRSSLWFSPTRSRSSLWFSPTHSWSSLWFSPYRSWRRIWISPSWPRGSLWISPTWPRGSLWISTYQSRSSLWFSPTCSRSSLWFSPTSEPIPLRTRFCGSTHFPAIRFPAAAPTQPRLSPVCTSSHDSPVPSWSFTTSFPLVQGR